MRGRGSWSLVLLVMAAATLTMVTPAAAQGYKRTTPARTTYFTNVHPNRRYQRTAPASTTPDELQPRVAANSGIYSREIAEASARHGVPERLIWAVIRVESGFDPRAVSPKGARGLMQLMPETAAILGVRDVFDPRENIQGGARHLRGLMERLRHDLPLALAEAKRAATP